MTQSVLTQSEDPAPEELAFPSFSAPQNLTYSLHEAGGGDDWWNRFQPSMEI